MPPVAAARSYRQRIHWIRGRFLGIETFSEEGKLIHFYLDEGFQPVQGAVDNERRFAEADILPPYLPFLDGGEVRWREGMSYWGIHPQRIELELAQKGRFAYRLVDGQTGAVWVDPERLRPFRLRTTILGTVPARTVTLEFGNFIVLEWREADDNPYYYPLHSQTLLDGRLIRETLVKDFQADPPVSGFPITRLRKLAGSVRPPQPVSLSSEE